MEQLVPATLAQPGMTVHELLTHVVEETAGLCTLMSQEYFGRPGMLGTQVSTG